MRGSVYPAFFSISLLLACAHVKPRSSEPPPEQGNSSASAPVAAVPMSESGAMPPEPVGQGGNAASGGSHSVKSTPGPKSPPVASARKKPPPAAAAPAPPVKPRLDFQALVQRLRDTSAIGVFTKLSLKNQVDDLLKAFRGYYSGQVPPSLDDLRQRYDGLLLKVVSLVQDGDASLASAISASRGAIWDKLSNRDSFRSLQ